MIRQKTLDKLEYGKVLQLVAQYAHSAPAREKALCLLPCENFNDSEDALRLTSQASDFLRYDGHLDFSIDDVKDICAQAKVLSTLSMGQLLKIMRQLRSARLLRKTLFTPYEKTDTSLLQQMADNLYENKALEDSIDFAIVSDEQMNDHASTQLFSIRKRIKQINADIRDKLASYTRKSDMSKFMQDSIVTLRDDRYVIPVKSEYKNVVDGIVHDQSASGSTVYIEPMAVVKLNNDLRTALNDEKTEISRILQEFTEHIAPIAESIKTNQDVISDLDLVFCKANYASDTKSTLPVLDRNGKINLKKARHPLIDAKKVVPITFVMAKGIDVVVITGPNTGGKTVTLKTVGLLTLMAMSGMFVPAEEESVVAFFGGVFCDIGDEQSIEQNLSTFSSHIVNIKDIISSVDTSSLVLIDEVGAGTEPNEGSALALAITDSLRTSGAKCLITTHYGQLKEYSLMTAGVENASMEFNPETFAPTYKLVMGVPGSSNAIAIAERLGLQSDVVTAARSSLSDEKVSFERVLQNADNIRRQYEEKVEEVQRDKDSLRRQLEDAQKLTAHLTEEREKLLKTSKQEAKRIVADASDEAKELLAKLKKLADQGYIEEKNVFDARNSLKTLQNTSFETEDDDKYVFTGDKVNLQKLKIGDRVFSKKLGVDVVVKEIKNTKITVSAGNLTTVLSADDLFECVVESKNKPTTKKLTSSGVRARDQHSEINVIGQTVMEAIANVDEFIDGAAMAGLGMVWIIHGKGSGKLRRGIQEHLSTLPSVKEFRSGVYGEGEEGVTVVTLK